MSQTVYIISLHRLVWTGLMAALVAVGAIISVPVGPFSPVPVTLQTMFVLLCGFTLGPRGGVTAILLYLAAGALGLPVFAVGKAGLAVFLGPTGGFLTGFIPAALICGFAGGRPLKPAPAMLGFAVLGTCMPLLCGALQLMLVLGISWGKVLAVGVLPFLPGAGLKCLAAAAIYRFLAARGLLPR